MTPLAGDLRRLADAVETGFLVGPVAERLAAAVADAIVCSRRDGAIRRLAEILDHGLPSRWETAGRVAAELDRFERSSRWREIRSGDRPRSTLEAACAVVLSCPGPRSQRRILSLLR